jgi:hypothetical protein
MKYLRFDCWETAHFPENMQGLSNDRIDIILYEITQETVEFEFHDVRKSILQEE